MGQNFIIIANFQKRITYKKWKNQGEKKRRKRENNNVPGNSRLYQGPNT